MVFLFYKGPVGQFPQNMITDKPDKSRRCIVISFAIAELSIIDAR
jgi:hypothetical protein